MGYVIHNATCPLLCKSNISCAVFFVGICEHSFTSAIVPSSTYLLLHHTLLGMIAFYSDFSRYYFFFKSDVWDCSVVMLCIFSQDSGLAYRRVWL